MTLRTSERGLALIREFEGLRLSGYVCPAGVPTIGYGHTEAAGGSIRYKDGSTSSKVIVGRAITKAEAERILKADIDRFEDDVERAIGPVMLAKLSPGQFDALVSLAFNIGPGAFGKSTVLKRVRAGTFDTVPAAMMMWVKAGGKTLPGLVRRRRAECALWRGLDDEIAAIGRDAFGDMPRNVGTIPPPKGMASSKTGWASIGTTAAGGIAAASEAIEVAGQAAYVGADVSEMIARVGPWVLLLIVIVACGAFIWWDRRRKLHEDLV